MNLRLIPAFALFTAVILGGCSKDDDCEDGGATPPIATPYVLETPSYFPKQEIPADNPLTVEGVDLGRHLFYEKRLSADNSISCGSCHQQSKAFTDGLAISPGVAGATGNRSAMSLANLMWVKELNWDGSAKSLEEQALTPLETHFEMNQLLSVSVSKLQETEFYPPMFEAAFGSRTITGENLLKALAQFQRTMVSSNSKYDQFIRRETFLTPLEEAGRKLFLTHPEPGSGIRGANCGDCHGGPLTTFNEFANNGLDETFADNGRGGVTGSQTDMGKFRAPTLRNIALTAPYMHDGRFQTLNEVLDHYNDHVKYNSPNLDPQIIEATNEIGGTTLKLTEQEKQAVIAFLHTLTDTSFTNNPKFSNPFSN